MNLKTTISALVLMSISISAYASNKACQGGMKINSPEIDRSVVLQFESAADVNERTVTCPAGTKTVELGIADCCMDGDHWYVEAETLEAKQVKAAVTANGVPGEFRTVRFDFADTTSTGERKTKAKISYLFGIDDFGANAYFYASCDGQAAVVQ